MSDANTQQTEETKRTRTSPRVKFGDEIVVMLDGILSDLGKQDAEDIEVAAKLELTSDIRGRVVSMIAEGVDKPSYNGRHYIGTKANGERVAFDSNVPPTRRSHGAETKHGFTSVLGPFRTSEGTAFRIEHPDTPCPVVF